MKEKKSLTADGHPMKHVGRPPVFPLCLGFMLRRCCQSVIVGHTSDLTEDEHIFLCCGKKGQCYAEVNCTLNSKIHLKLSGSISKGLFHNQVNWAFYFF